MKYKKQTAGAFMGNNGSAGEKIKYVAILLFLYKEKKWTNNEKKPVCVNSCVEN